MDSLWVVIVGSRCGQSLWAVIVGSHCGKIYILLLVKKFHYFVCGLSIQNSCLIDMEKVDSILRYLMTPSPCSGDSQTYIPRLVEACIYHHQYCTVVDRVTKITLTFLTKTQTFFSKWSSLSNFFQTVYSKQSPTISSQ